MHQFDMHQFDMHQFDMRYHRSDGCYGGGVLRGGAVTELVRASLGHGNGIEERIVGLVDADHVVLGDDEPLELFKGRRL